MITPDFAFVQKCAIQKYIGRGINADEYSEHVSVRCRVNFERKKLTVNRGGSVQEIVAAGSVWLPAGTDVSEGDRIAFAGKTYAVESVQRCYDIFGVENHIETAVR